MTYTNLLVERNDMGVYTLTVNRPKALNALNRETTLELDAALDEIGNDASARVLLVTGGGEKAFVAGADVKEMQPLDPIAAREFSQLIQAVFRKLETLPIPSIAVVNGYCLGAGCELAMSCDWIIAGQDAVFGLPEVTLGVIPGAGGTQRMSRLVGPARAMELVATGRFVKPDEALAIGLVNTVHPTESLMDAAMDSAQTIAANGSLAVRIAKEAISRGLEMNLENACAYERESFGLCFATEDQAEGMSAFAEKRKAVFKGR